MSKLTLEDAISHCLEVAENNETQAEKIGRQFIGSAMDKCATDCRECAAEHRQLAEWLTELKELRNSVGAFKLVEMKDALNLISEYKAELFEAKQLLKAAVEDMEQANQKGRCSTCVYNLHNAKGLIGKCQACHYFSLWKWRNEAEALALIGEDINVPTGEDGDTNG